MTGKTEKTQTNTNAKFWELMEVFTDLNVMKYYHETRKLDRFKYQKNEKDGIWFEYLDNNVLERRGDETLFFQSKMKDELVNEMKEQQEELQKNQGTIEFKSKNELIKKNIKCISQVGFLKKAWKAYSEFVGSYDLIQTLDNDGDLIAFDNKLYDHKSKTFRAIEKSDLITFTAGYNIKLEKNKEAKKFINKTLTEIFPDEQMRKFWLLAIALSLTTNRMQRLFIWTGRGSNGKSLLNEFVQYCFGNYYKTAGEKFLIGDKTNNYDSDLASATGKRILVCSEPPTGEKLNSGYMKRITGDSTIQTREIYGKAFDLKVLFVPHLLTNDLPPLTETNDAIQRRIEIIKFDVRFSKDPKGNEKQIDYNLKEKLLTFENRNEFMLMLFDILKTAKSEDVEASRPKASTEALQKYMEDNDAIIPYMQEFLKITNDEKDRIQSSELYDHYLKNTPEALSKLSAQKFSKALESHGLKKVKSHGIGKWACVKFRDPIEESFEPEQKEEIKEEVKEEVKEEPKTEELKVFEKWGFTYTEEEVVDCPSIQARKERVKAKKPETLNTKSPSSRLLANVLGLDVAQKPKFSIQFD